MLRRALLAAVICGGFCGALRAADTSPAVATSVEEAGPDYAIQGEYQGELTTPDQAEMLKVGAQVIADGDGKFRGVFYFGGLPGDGWERGQPQIEAEGVTEDGKIMFTGEGGTAVIENGKMKVLGPGGEELSTLEKVERKSPTLGAKPPEGAIVLFDGTGTEHWKGAKVVDGNLLAGTIGTDDLQDFTLHLEFRTPFMPRAHGQARGNSGVYLQDRYECQVLDSFGLEGKDNECGGFYQIKEPAVNMCFPPLAWQTYDIDFTAARFEGDKKVSNAKVTVKHNGVAIFEDFELPNLTPGGAPTEAPGKGPLKLQDHGNPVAYRNIWVIEK